MGKYCNENNGIYIGDLYISQKLKKIHSYSHASNSILKQMLLIFDIEIGSKNISFHSTWNDSPLSA